MNRSLNSSILLLCHCSAHLLVDCCGAFPLLVGPVSAKTCFEGLCAKCLEGSLGSLSAKCAAELSARKGVNVRQGELILSQLSLFPHGRLQLVC
jgi:hypothetical protein